MLEHEQFGASSSIASRGTSVLLTMGPNGTHELNKSFLLKRMEIDFLVTADLNTNDATHSVQAPYYLVFHNIEVSAQINTVAENFDSRLDDRQGHQPVIWTRPFLVDPYLVDDSDNVTLKGQGVAFKTSKSFSKGFRLDKDELYTWSIFNPFTSALDVIGFVGLKVRYWGVYIE